MSRNTQHTHTPPRACARANAHMACPVDRAIYWITLEILNFTEVTRKQTDMTESELKVNQS